MRASSHRTHRNCAALLLVLSASATVGVPRLDAQFGQRMSPQQAYERIARSYESYFHTKDEKRPKRMSEAEWPANASRLLRVQIPVMPILAEPSFSGRTLHVLGLARSGEVLEILEESRFMALMNPLSNEPDPSGGWFRVWIPDGRTGWVFGVPDNGPAMVQLITRPDWAAIRRRAELEREKEQTATLVFAGGVLLLTLLLVVRHRSRRSTRARATLGAGSASAYGSSAGREASPSRPQSSATAPATSAPDAEWPWHGDTVIGESGVQEKSWFGSSKVGHVETHWGIDEIHKDGTLSSDKVGEVVKDWLGNPSHIVDTHGEKVADIKTDWLGRTVMVDKDGKEIGEYKKK